MAEAENAQGLVDLRVDDAGRAAVLRLRAAGHSFGD